MRITSKGQVTIPVRIRKKLGLLAETEVTFEIAGDAVKIRKVRGSRNRGPSLVRRMKGRGTSSMSTDEILALTRG